MGLVWTPHAAQCSVGLIYSSCVGQGLTGAYGRLCCRYHVTLHDSSKLDMLQDRLEDLPQPVVVGSCWLGPLMQLMQNIKSDCADTAGWGGAM